MKMSKLIKKLTAEEGGGTTTDVDVSVTVSDTVAQVEETNETIDEMTDEADVIEEVEESSVTLENYANSIKANGLSAGMLSAMTANKLLVMLANNKNKTLPAVESLDVIGENPVEADEVVTTIEEIQDTTLTETAEQSFERFITLASKLEGNLYKTAKTQVSLVRAIMEVAEGTEDEKVEKIIEDNSVTPLEGMSGNEATEVEATIDALPASEQPEELSEQDVAEVLTKIAEPQEHATVPDTDIVDKDSAVEYLRTCLNIIETSNRNSLNCLANIKAFASQGKVKTGSERLTELRRVATFGRNMLLVNRKAARRALKSANTVFKLLNNDSVINVKEPEVTYTPGSGK